MAVEIEHKFLVLSNSWQNACVGKVHLRDGLIASTSGRKVRVRIADDRGFITVKGARSGNTRDEFEYEIPLLDAEALHAEHCDEMVVAKTRHFVVEEGFTFEVDVYEGPLDGIVIAEAELAFPGQTFPRPLWLGDEVTGRPEYGKATMLRARIADAVSCVP